MYCYVEEEGTAILQCSFVVDWLLLGAFYDLVCG